MWDSKKSVFLSTILTDFFGLFVIVSCFVFPSFLRWYLGYTARAFKRASIVLYTYYPCVPFVLCALVILHILLCNIKKGKIFVLTNVKLMRAISWCCFAVAAVTLIGGYFYLPFLLVAVIMTLVGLIIRVIKNIFCKAIELKDENDMTI